MYSLYRAWLSMSQTQQPEHQPLNLSAPLISGPGMPNAPDIQLQVGPSLTTFSAHRNVLSNHSGFFKAALLGSTQAQSFAPIIVPNIQVDEFSSLLTFMYTGYLDLNLGNIYNILLATHILHMPRALELCRNFLMQAQQQQNAPCPGPSCVPTIVKPIASKKPLSGFPLQEEAPKDPERHLFNSTSVFKKFMAASDEQEQQEPEQEQPSTSSTVVAKSRHKKEKDKHKDKNKKRPSPGSASFHATTTVVEDQRTIIDIACCDGPVRFHRVVNKNYGQGQSKPQTETVTSEPDPDEDQPQNKKLTLTTEAAINKVMTENILQATTSASSEKPQTDTVNTNSVNSTDLYTCLYCNHTFKSQYCYQKHARRHLNPVDPVKITTTVGNKTTGNNKRTVAGRQDGSGTGACVALASKREFKLLDMNVQYYPCKTCGSKFPSYYFVHKHRKLCHAEEMADGSNKNNEIVQVKPKTGSTSGGANGKKAKNDENSNAAVGTCEHVEGDASRNDQESNHVSVSNEESCHSDIIDVEETND